MQSFNMKLFLSFSLSIAAILIAIQFFSVRDMLWNTSKKYNGGVVQTTSQQSDINSARSATTSVQQNPNRESSQEFLMSSEVKE